MYRVNYTDKRTGEQRVHQHQGSESSARGWQQTLRRENGGRVTLEHLADGPYDYSGKITHISTEGDN